MFQRHFSLAQKDTVCQQSHVVYVSAALNRYALSYVTWMTNAVNSRLLGQGGVTSLKCLVFVLQSSSLPQEQIKVSICISKT